MLTILISNNSWVRTWLLLMTAVSSDVTIGQGHRQDCNIIWQLLYLTITQLNYHLNISCDRCVGISPHLSWSPHSPCKQSCSNTWLTITCLDYHLTFTCHYLSGSPHSHGRQYYNDNWLLLDYNLWQIRRDCNNTWQLFY